MSWELEMVRQQNLQQKFQWRNPASSPFSSACSLSHYMTRSDTSSHPALMSSKKLITCLTSWPSQFYSTEFNPSYQVTSSLSIYLISGYKSPGMKLTLNNHLYVHERLFLVNVWASHLFYMHQRLTTIHTRLWKVN